MSESVRAVYEARLEAGEIEPDPAQRQMVEQLDRLSSDLVSQKSKRGGLVRLVRDRSSGKGVRGIYIHGSVGRGKTMLMDLFHDAVPFSPKRRAHFHEFMGEVHDRIKIARETTAGDPIPLVASEIAGEAGLICLDELQVTDIADAMILGRLFKVFFEKGTVIVATSNSPPSGLYKDGLNRQLFLPFITLISERMETVQLAAERDYRLTKLRGRQLYFTPDDAAARSELDRHWDRLTGRHPAQPITLEVKGRKLLVEQASMGVARLSFADLCERPLGAGDYLQLAHAFHTVMVDGIPRLGPERRNAARRLVTLVDALYDNRVCLIASAEREPHELYPEGDGALMFERTVSRLIEMRSEAYLARHSESTRKGAAIEASRS